MLPNQKATSEEDERKNNMKNLKKETIKKLEEIKDNLNYDNSENYANIINTLIDYDNDAQDEVYLYDNIVQLIDIVDDETLQYYVDYQIKTFGQDRYFYMFNQVNNICGVYVIDGYGNLRDITQDDLIEMIDESIDRLKESEVNE